MHDGEAKAAISGDAPRDVRRPHIEGQLIGAFTRLVAEGRSPAEVSVAQLARQAGIGRATFYLYFADRQAFNRRLVEFSSEQLAEPLERLWAAVTDDGPQADGAVLGFLRAYRDLGPLMTAVADAAATDPAIGQLVQQGMDEMIERTAAALEAGKASGAIEPEVPLQETAAVLVWMAERACYQVARTADEAELERLALALSFVSRRGVSVEK